MDLKINGSKFQVPVVHFIPTLDFKGKPGVYPCPVYKAPDLALHGDVWLQCHSVKGLLLSLNRQIWPLPWIRHAGLEQKGYIVHNRTQYEFCSRHDSADDG